MKRKKKKPAPNPILKEIAATKQELDAAYSRFENVVDPDLIDATIYQVNSIQMRYKYLMRQLKQFENHG